MIPRDAFHVFVRAFGLWLVTHSAIGLITLLWQSPPWNGAEVGAFLPSVIGLIVGAFFLLGGDVIAGRVFGGGASN